MKVFLTLALREWHHLELLSSNPVPSFGSSSASSACYAISSMAKLVYYSLQVLQCEKMQLDVSGGSSLVIMSYIGLTLHKSRSLILLLHFLVRLAGHTRRDFACPIFLNLQQQRQIFVLHPLTPKAGLTWSSASRSCSSCTSPSTAISISRSSSSSIAFASGTAVSCLGRLRRAALGCR